MFTGNTISVIGAVAAGAVGILRFAKDDLPEHHDRKSTLKVGVTLHYADEKPGTTPPDVHLWDEQGKYVGTPSDGVALDPPETAVLTVDHGASGSEMAPYALFSAPDKAICVAFATISWPDGEDVYGWTGDWGKQCGGSWFYSNQVMKDSDYKPACLWIDPSRKKPHSGFSLHWPAFRTNADTPTKAMNETDICADETAFQLHAEFRPNTVPFPPGTAGEAAPISQAQRRAQEPLPPVHWTFPRRDEGRLVISDDAANHPTQALCDSPTSSGPDLANVAERRFCRMADKSMWPLCSRGGEYNCFDIATHALIPGAPDEETVRTYGYHVIYDWRTGQH